MHQAAVEHPPSDAETGALVPPPLLRRLVENLIAVDAGWECTPHLACDGGWLLMVEEASGIGTWIVTAAANGMLCVERLDDGAWLTIEGIATPDQVVRRFAAAPVRATIS